MSTKHTPHHNRRTDLDVFRGFAVVLMILVTKQNPFSQFRHAPWEGFTLADLAFPFFLFIAGVSMGLSFARRDAMGVPRSTQRKQLLSRLGRLALLGFVLTMLSKNKFVVTLGTLQCLALSLFVASNFLFCSFRTLLVAGLIVPLLYLLAIVLADPSLPWLEHFSRDHTLTERVDRYFFGEHRAEEGVIPLFVNAAYVLLGLAISKLIGTQNDTTQNHSRIGALVIGLGIFGVIVAFLPHFPVPINARIASPTFVWIASSLSIGGFFACSAMLHRQSAAYFLKPIATIGSNALVAYVGTKLFVLWILEGIQISSTVPEQTLRTWLRSEVASLFGPAAGALTTPCLKLIFAWAVCTVLARRKIFVRI